MESKQGKDLVMPITEARGLRDELAKLLADRVDPKEKVEVEPVLKFDIKGGSFK